MNLNSGLVWRSFDQTHTRPGISSLLRDEEPPPPLLLLLLLLLMELTIDACDEYDIPNDDNDDEDDEEDDALEP